VSADDLLRRVPPQNIEAEQSVLGALLIVPARGEDLVQSQAQVLSEVATVVCPEDFYRESHREIFRAMLDLSQRRLPIDAVLMTDRLRSTGTLESVGGPGYIAELAAAVPTAANIAYYASIVRKKSVLRALASAATEIASNAYESPHEVRECVAAAEARMSAVARMPIGEEEPDLRGAMAELLADIEGGRLAGVPSGFPELDRCLTAGGFSRGGLYTIAAPTSGGKTAIALNMAIRGSRAGGTLFLSCEMNRDELLRRLIADLGSVDWAWIAQRRPPQPNNDEAKRIAQEMERLCAMKLDIRYRRRLTPAEIRRESLLARARFEGKLDLIIVDYLQLLDPDTPQKRRDLEIGSITKELKNIAGELDVALLLLSQLNREGVKPESKEPELWHLKESSSIEQDSDGVIFSWQSAESREREKAEKFGPIRIDWKIAKQRNGVRTGLEPMKFEREFTRFRPNKCGFVADEVK
jgi:replicative DNA helicase